MCGRAARLGITGIPRITGIVIGAVALLAFPTPMEAFQALGSVILTAPPPRDTAPLDSLLSVLDGFDRARLHELEVRYERSGNPEKRLLERRFGTIEHRYRVDADPRGIYRALKGDGPGTRSRGAVDPERAIEEVLAGRFTAYYFFDGVIRPNVFAREPRRGRVESALHEKVHLIQPGVYRSLGIACRWLYRGDGCVRSLEPVAVYLTEYALLARRFPGRPEAEINGDIERWLALEAVRCGYGASVRRCPAGERAPDYVLLPLDLAREVARHGLEEGIRRFVSGLDVTPLASAPSAVSP